MDDAKFHFSIDRGGTFTDIYCILPNKESYVTKLLSQDPTNYKDAPTEGIRRILSRFDESTQYPKSAKVATHNIGSIRMGTTVATNALLERKGSKVGLLITKGFKDLLLIGNQSRSDIFDLSCWTPGILYDAVVEIDERVILDKYISGSIYDKNADENVTFERDIGITGEGVVILKKPESSQIRAQLQSLVDQNITSIAIVLAHAYTYDKHEQIIADIAEEMNYFTYISQSSKTMNMVKMTSRGQTTCAAAYLTPVLSLYLNGFKDGFDEFLEKNVALSFMKSDGGLTDMNDFGGHQAILSGPAGGVVGYSKTSYRKYFSENDSSIDVEPQPVIGFDMGGTSTDVSRYDGSLEHVFETTIAGVSIQSAQLDIHTVAAGGGSRLFFNEISGMFIVGPESSGAHPGPICYRKNGYLSVTDANLVLGRIIPEHFPCIFGPNEDLPLDLKGAWSAFEELCLKEGKGRTVEEMAYGFIKVANESMCRPIRNLTQMKGYDITQHKLACFGGAGPQHACAIAKSLGMKKVSIHKYGGILSAYGLSMADAVQEEQEPAAEVYEYWDSRKLGIHDDPSFDKRTERFLFLAEKASSVLVNHGYKSDQIIIERYLNLRYDGTDTSMMIKEMIDPFSSCVISYADTFRSYYQREFGFGLEGRNILIDDFRVRAIVEGFTPGPCSYVSLKSSPIPSCTTKAYFEDGWELETPVFQFYQLQPGHVINGPAIIVQNISTIVVEKGCSANVTFDGDLDVFIKSTVKPQEDVLTRPDSDPILLSIFSHRFMGIAEQMGRVLQRTAISVNMKERLDFSCALFSSDGGLVANAPHIPVHLGAMQAAVKFQVDYWSSEGREGIQEGDVLVSNHPQLAGGSHLPDITVISPVFHDGKIIFFVASRGHHSDVGGITPGSMPPTSKRLEEEGAIIIALKLVKHGHFQEDEIIKILKSPGKIQGCSGSRNLSDNLSDLRAQVAANNSGIKLLQDLVKEYGLLTVQSYMKFIQLSAESSVRSMLKEFALLHGSRTEAVDYMDDGTPIKLVISIDMDSGDALFDFTGTGPQVLANHNAPPSVTYSAVIYSLRSLVGKDIPLNQGCLEPISFIIPKFSVLNPSDNAAVVGGNVVTSQRVVDVILKAFKACAASQGCMNNLTFGDDKFGYYETIAGGSGAGPTWNGRSGVHTHCTNTRITDVEVLERRYPVILRQFSLRPGSGGIGLHRGGDGVVREIEPLRPLVTSILSERRVLPPYGLQGGSAGKCGINLLIKTDGLIINVGGKASFTISKGDRLRIETPGGGGYGQ